MATSKRLIGYNSKGLYKTGEKGKAFAVYSCWKDMLDRCYVKTTARWKSHGKRGVKVCDEWLDFQVFAEWYYLNYKNGYHLDKDIVNPFAKLYSPETCKFVPAYINCLILNKSKNYNGLPRGVIYRKNRGKYVAQLFIDGKCKRVGSFLTIDEAFDCYKYHKEQYIKIVAEKAFECGDIDLETYKALVNYDVQKFSENY